MVAAGDQAITFLNTSTDQVVAIEIFGTGIQNANGLAARFEYDASQVVYDGFDTGDVLPNAQALPEHGTNPTYVEIGIVSLGGQATASSGLLGAIRFRTTGAFSGTEIRLMRAELSRGGRFETVTIDIRIALQASISDAPSPDFDGNGIVDLADFLAFVDQFGTRQGDGRYDAKYDLDSDGAVGISDFLSFANDFGKTPRVDIPDANLRAVIADSLGKARGAPISSSEMASLTRLVVPDSEISDLTGLEFATNLTRLTFRAPFYLDKGRFISSNDISDLSPLSGLTNLTHLNLRATSITDVSPLSGLTNLRELYLSNNSITDVSALSGLTNLRELSLSDNSIMDVSALAGLIYLEWLWLSDNSITDVSAFSSGFASLKWLYLSNNSITDVSALSGLTNLRELHLSNNSITDVSALSGLTNLTYLYLHYNSITDVSALSGLTNLRELYLHYNSITDVSALSGLTNLRDLSLSNTSITDVSAFSSGFASLKWLYLSNTSITDVSPLSGLTNLTRLFLSNTSITDVSPLSGLTNLRELSLSDNSITDVSPLSGLTNLTYLWLQSNSISDLSPLVANTGLDSGDRVDVRNNPLSDTSFYTHIPALLARGVNVRFGSSKPAVEEIEWSKIQEEWEKEGGYISRKGMAATPGHTAR